MRADIAHILALETAVWQALVDGDDAADTRLLTEDFLGVYPSGFATRSDHAGQLHDGPTVAVFQLSDARLMTITDNAAMLSYRAAFTRPADPASEIVWYVSSLWCERNGEWVNSFSQDTVAN